MAVGLPTNTNLYMPLADSPAIRKLSLKNFSRNDGALSLNGPAYVLLDVSDLGTSFDLKMLGSGAYDKTQKQKDINLKILINYMPDPSDPTGKTPMANKSIYDALEDFLMKIGSADPSNAVNYDRRGFDSMALPDLCLLWDTPTAGDTVTKTRYKDVVVTEVQWTQVDKQYQGIIVELSLKPISRWYYRIVKEIVRYDYPAQKYVTCGPMETSSGGMTYGTIASINELNPSHADFAGAIVDPDADIPWGVRMKMDSHTASSKRGNIYFGMLSIPFVAYPQSQRNGIITFQSKWNTTKLICMGNLRGVPYLNVEEDVRESNFVMPGSATNVVIRPGGFSSQEYYIKLCVEQEIFVNGEVEYHLPLRF